MFSPLLEQWDADLRSGNPLDFPGYAEKLAGLDRESVRTGLADGYVLIEGDFDVIGGSMGLVHGEKVVRAFDRATEARLPVVVVTRSGGARMQEGMVSLIQMARTAAAAQRHHRAGLLSISVHRSPTTGGVFASYGSLSDLSVAEAGATIGFAGPRVVQQTTGDEVGDTSHSAETALAAHLVDAVAPAEDLYDWVQIALGRRAVPLELPRPPTPIRQAASEPVNRAWGEVQAARAMGRPSGTHVAAATTTSWLELGLGTDAALRTALAVIGGEQVMAVAFDRYAKGGRPTAAGYRLAQRGIALAGRLGIAIVTFIDTPGADSTPEAENDGIAGEIARTFAVMADAASPTVAICVGEGGSGGALALGAADRLLIQRHGVFSVIAPEGAATILERNSDKAASVAPALGLTSDDLLSLGIVDEVVDDALPATVDALERCLASARAGAYDRQRRTRFDTATARGLRVASSAD